MRTLFFISLCCFMLLAKEATDHDTHGAAPDQGHGTTHNDNSHGDNSHGEVPIEGKHTMEGGGGHREKGGEHHEEGGHHSTQPSVVLFVFFGLFAGSVLRELNKKTKFPYTPMLIILGIIMGIYHKHLVFIVINNILGGTGKGSRDIRRYQSPYDSFRVHSSLNF